MKIRKEAGLKDTTNPTQIDLELVWFEYRNRLARFLRSKVSNPDDVEDLLQDILLKVHQNIDTLEQRERLKPWLFQIANNTIIDFYREKTRKAMPQAEELWYDDPGAEDKHLLEECVIPFVDALPPEMSDILHLIDLQGVSQKSYAEEHGISYSTLKTRVQTSRLQLRKLFENCCEFTVDSHGNIIDYERKIQDQEAGCS